MLAAAAHPPTNGEAAPQQQPDSTAQARCANALAASQAELHKLEQELVAKRAQVAEAAAHAQVSSEQGGGPLARGRVALPGDHMRTTHAHGLHTCARSHARDMRTCAPPPR